MKAIWLILITMVLFNGFLFTFGMFFQASPYQSGLYKINNVTGNKTFEGYKQPGLLNFSVSNILFMSSVPLIAGAIGTLMTFLFRNLQYIAAGGMVALISGLWTSTIAIFGNMLNGNTILLGIYTLISIAIGIIVAILILGIFTGQDQLGYG